ncbi:Cyanovirin-N [Aspergillus coremiiformis]|uniref:Cyanovirin-N n=1 Tax=Aspergillus coremiiformis TaxID=138285 RepID=A0A5N6ZGX7_9EURO|nr:Cyanovirin-N [Aspergillus coremiiformis]
MSFHLSAEEGSCRVEGPILYARLRNNAGDFISTELDLNRYLGNDNGRFHWDGVNFFETAEPGSVTFSIEGGSQVPVLRARLASPDGEYHDADVNLDERIINEDGHFTFQA